LICFFILSEQLYLTFYFILFFLKERWKHFINKPKK